MGPIEAELRGHPGPDASDGEFWDWAWELTCHGIYGLGVTAFSALSDVYVPVDGRRLGRPGFGLTLHASHGRLRDAISEAIEAAEALGL